jgi:acetyl esterase/lipase
MTSWSAAAVRLYISNIRRSKATFASAQATEASIEDLYLHPQSYAPPATLKLDIDIKRVDINAWPLYCVSSKATKPKSSQQNGRRAIVYIHGGAFYREIDPDHWHLIAQLASETGLDVLVPIYPLVPRPTATAEQVIQGVIDICLGCKHEVICAAGDSAGGAIALATVQRIQKDAPKIAQKLQSVVLISPVLDCTFGHPENLRLAANDPWLGIDGLRVAGKRWAGDLSIENPRVSPLHGGIKDLPPILLFAGTADLLCADARRLSARFQGKSVDDVAAGSAEARGLTYVEHPDMIHVYPILPHWEGGEARKQIVAFTTKHLD